MVNLINIKRKHGQRIEAEVRVMRPAWQTATNGRNYLRCKLVDSTDTLDSYLWQPTAADSALMTQGRIIKVSGTGRQLAHQFHLEIERIEESDNLAASISTLPIDACPLNGGLQNLQQHVESIEEPSLRKFIYRLFSDSDVALLYLTVPASHQHHHAEPGGMLRHCLEMAYVCRSLEEPLGLSPNELSLLITAALTHDIGKIHTHGSKNWSKWITPHDSHTLEVMATPLGLLEKDWPDGAEALRYLLTWKQVSNRDKFPMMTIARILEMADQLSAAKDVEAKAFSCKEPAANYASWSGSGPTNRFWRPRKSLSLYTGQGVNS